MPDQAPVVVHPLMDGHTDDSGLTGETDESAGGVVEVEREHRAGAVSLDQREFEGVGFTVFRVDQGEPDGTHGLVGTERELHVVEAVEGPRGRSVVGEVSAEIVAACLPVRILR